MRLSDLHNLSKWFTLQLHRKLHTPTTKRIAGFSGRPVVPLRSVFMATVTRKEDAHTKKVEISVESGTPTISAIPLMYPCGGLPAYIRVKASSVRALWYAVS